ncbi:MAG: DHHW family protein [Clostridia bacterium]
MKDKVKYIVIITLFALIIGGFFVLNLILPDKDISYDERRPLQQFPKITWEQVESTKFMTNFDKYSLDQFAFRDSWRSIKAFWLYNVFQQKDNNGVYQVDGNVSKLQYPLKEQSIVNATKKFNKIMQKYFPDANVFYSLIPDKNYFMAKPNGYLDLDYDKLQELLAEGLDENMTYINILGDLEADDYYLTDHHWSQDKIVDVAKTIAKDMGFLSAIENLTYDKNTIDGFKGVYGGQYPLPLAPESLVYLTNDLMKNWTVKVMDSKLNMVESSIYAVDKFTGTDPYDVFLHGATPLVTIENKNNTSGKELFVFRDSFSSSLAPLLVEGYSKVTLIDIRYIGAEFLGDYVDFGKGNDVLFIYGTAVLNESAMLKGLK